MSEEYEQLFIIEKYEEFINYFYKVAQNIPREHGVAKAMFLTALLGQVELFTLAGKSHQISRLHQADAGISNLRYWLRFMAHKNRRIITPKQHQIGSIMLAEVGRILGAWMKKSTKKV